MKQQLRFLMLTLLCAVVGTAWAAETAYKTLTFSTDTNQSSVNNYNSSWSAIAGGFHWDLVNFNNNNSGWNYVKCGNKTNASVATITTNSVIDVAITKVVVTINNITANKVNSTKLEVASDASFSTNLQTISKDPAAGEVTYTVPNPTENQYYRLTYDCKKGDSNGLVTISKVEYFYNDNTPQKTDIAKINNISPMSIVAGKSGNFTADITPANSDYTISWSSTGSALSVTENGAYEALSIGTATVTVTVTPNNTNNYNTVSKTFEVSVSEPVVATIYEKVTSSSQLVPGNEYILVAIGAIDNDNNTIAMGAQWGSVRDYNTVTISDDKITITNQSVAVLTLGGSTDNWTFLASDNNEYLAYTATNNQINSSTTVTDNAKWTITEDFELKNNVSFRYLRYNSSSPRFACYTSGQTTSVLFVKQGSQTNTKSDPELSFGDVTSFTAEIGGTFTAPALVNPNKLTGITYSSNDTDLATVDATSGEVTIGDNEGEVTITASFAGNDYYNPGSASYTITVSQPELPDPELTVTNAPNAMYIDGEITLVCNSKSEGAITFSSSNGNVTVDANGKLTAVNAGTATITVSQAATEEYKAGEVTFTVKVINPNNSQKYVKVTNPNQLKADNTYIIVAEESDGGSYAMGTQSGQYRNAEPVVVANNEAYTDDAQELTLGGIAGMWTLTAENGMLCLVNLPETGGKIESTEAQNATEMQKSWRINEENFTVSNRENPYWFIQFNYNQGNYPRFACYRNTGNLTSAYLYVKDPYTTDDEFHADPLFSINNIIVEMGDNNRQLGVNTPSDGKNNISFTFDDNSIAEIVNNGDGTYTVNPLAEGETTVDASLPRTDSYELANYTFTIKVVGQFNELASDVYQKITSQDELTTGKYLIVYEDGSLVFDGNREILEAANNFKEVTITDDKIYCPSSYFMIDVENGTIQSQSGFYIGATKSGDNELKTSKDAEQYINSIVIDETNGVLINTNGVTNKYLRFNKADGQKRFRYFKDNNGSHTQQPIQLYKAIVENTFDFNISEQATDGTDHYATIADLGMGYFKVTGGVDVYTVVVVGNKLSFPIHFSDGDAIPGDGAYLVKGNARPDPADPYKFPATISPDEEVDLGENMLHSTGEGNLSAEDMAAAYDPDTKFYKLSLYKGKVGFFYGDPNGAAFNYTKPHQAYLALEPAKIAEPGGDSGSQNISGFYFDGTTAISEVLSESSTDNATYTLSGIRVDGKNLPKGIYIVNGKKVVIK